MTRRVDAFAGDRLPISATKLAASMIDAIKAAAQRIVAAVTTEASNLRELLEARHHEAMRALRIQAHARQRLAIWPAAPAHHLGALSEPAQELIDLVMADMPTQTALLSPEQLDATMGGLAAGFDGKITGDVAGHSTQGRAISTFTVHGGPRTVVVVGGVHANEPLGGITITYLARKLAEHDALRERLGYTWVFIPCIDPDSAALNTWIAREFSRTRDEMRPAFWEQPAMTLPCQHRGDDGLLVDVSPKLAEMLALKNVIDQHRASLAFAVELHNSDKSCYYLMSEAAWRLPPNVLTPLLRDLPQIAPRWGIPVIRNPQEEISAQPLAQPGITSLTAQTSVHGQPLAGYLGPAVPLFQPEVPLFVHPAEWNESPCGRTFAHVLAEDYLPPRRMVRDFLISGFNDIAGEIAPSRHLSMVRSHLSVGGRVDEQAAEVMRSPAARRQATVSEEHSLRDYAWGVTIRRVTSFARRALDAGLGPNPSRRAIAFRAALLEREVTWARRAEDITGWRTPLTHAGATQAASVLVFAEHLGRTA